MDPLSKKTHNSYLSARASSIFYYKRTRLCLPALIIFLLLIFSFLPQIAEAGIVTLRNPLKYDNLWDLIDKLIDFVFKMAIGIAPIMFLVAGFYFITAAGNMEKVTTAKKMILWTMIGLLIVFMAKALIVFFAREFDIDLPFIK